MKISNPPCPNYSGVRSIQKNTVKGPKKRIIKLINNNPRININKVDKNLLLEIQSQNKEYKKSLTITPWGIEGSPKIINYDEGCSTYFGYDVGTNKVR